MRKIVVIMLATLIGHVSIAQDGTFDTSFGSDGVTIFSLGEMSTRGFFIMQLPDGNILAAGNGNDNLSNAFIVRTDPDGVIDTTFGDDGMLLFPNGPNGTSLISSMSLQEDGMVLLTGKIHGTRMLFRMEADGTMDPTFGDGGFKPIDEGSAIGVQSGERIVVAGHYYDGTNNLYRFARYHLDGSIDTSFGDGGAQLTDPTPYPTDWIYAIHVTSDQKVITVGTSAQPYEHHAVVTRFNEDGSLDPTFGNDGVVITPAGPPPGYAVLHDVDVLADGRIVAGGFIEYSGGTGGFYGNKSLIIRYEPNGELDTSFGDGGIVVLEPVFNANDRLNAVKVQMDGKILVGGITSYPFPYMKTFMYIARLNSDGSMDMGFGDGGMMLSDLSGAETTVTHDVAIQSDGKILATGISRNDGAPYFDTFLCRLNNENTVNIPETDNGAGLTISPNPTTGPVNIQCAGHGIITIHDMQGRLVKQLPARSLNEGVIMDITSLPFGSYVIVVSMDDRQYHGRVSKY